MNPYPQFLPRDAL